MKSSLLNFILKVLMISTMCCMICMLHIFLLDWTHFMTNTRIQVHLFPFILFNCGDKKYWMGSSYIHDVWPQYVCLHDSVLHNHLQALVLIHFGFVIQAARRCEYDNVVFLAVALVNGALCSNCTCSTWFLWYVHWIYLTVSSFSVTVKMNPQR